MCRCIGPNQSKIDNQILQAKKLMSLSTSHQIGCPEARLFQVCASMFASCVHNFINTLKLVMFSFLDFGVFSVLWSNVCKTYVFPIGRSSEDVSFLFCLCSCPFGLSLCKGKRSFFLCKTSVFNVRLLGMWGFPKHLEPRVHSAFMWSTRKNWYGFQLNVNFKNWFVLLASTLHCVLWEHENQTK